MQGYTVQFVKKVKSGDSSKPGVFLGQQAVKKEIPIAVVASSVGVSRMAVYDWFTGRYNPQPHHESALREFVEGYVAPAKTK